MNYSNVFDRVMKEAKLIFLGWRNNFLYSLWNCCLEFYQSSNTISRCFKRVWYYLFNFDWSFFSKRTNDIF